MAPSSTFVKRKPLHSGSPVFDAAHELFLDDIFQNDIKAVSVIDTALSKEVILADMAKFVASKKTGQIEVKYRVSHDSSWKKVPKNVKPAWLQNLSKTKFFSSSQIVGYLLTASWEHRLSGYLPSAETCFGKSEQTPNRYTPGPAQKFRTSLFLAARRRAGSKAIDESMKRRFVHGLWNVVGSKKTVLLCLRFFGYHATIEDYNLTVRFQEELRRFHQETPSLCPLVGRYILQHRKQLNTLPSDIVSLAKTWLSSSDETALTPVGWRFLASQTAFGVERLLWLRNDGNSPMNALCNLMGHCGLKPPVSLLTWLMRMLRDLEYSPDTRTSLSQESQDSLARFVRLLCEQALLAKKKSKLTDFIRNEVPLVWDYVSQSGLDLDSPHRKLIRLGKGLTWQTLWRRQREWHVVINQKRAEQAALLAAEQEQLNREHAARIEQIMSASWDFAVVDGVLEGVRFEALPSTMALQREGAKMQHCVDGLSYAKACIAGTSRIFHLTHGQDEATVEICASDRRWWSVSQVYGFEDSTASKPMWRAAKKLATMYRQAQRKQKPATGLHA